MCLFVLCVSFVVIAFMFWCHASTISTAASSSSEGFEIVCSKDGSQMTQGPSTGTSTAGESPT